MLLWISRGTAFAGGGSQTGRLPLLGFGCYLLGLLRGS